MAYYHRVVLYFDGASRNNPHGPAGCGWALYNMDQRGADSFRIAYGREYLGYNVSNNQAEYEGLINGLTYIRKNMKCDGLYVRGDSEIVIRQMEGQYQVRSDKIRPYYNEAMNALKDIDCQFRSFRHINRSANWEADQLAKSVL